MYYGHPPHTPSEDDLTILHCRCGWFSDELTQGDMRALGVPWYCDACDKQVRLYVRFHPHERVAAHRAIGLA